jgi:hypothetical protein
MARPAHPHPLPPHPRGTPVEWICRKCKAAGFAFPGKDEHGIPYRPLDFRSTCTGDGRASWTGTRGRALCGACSRRAG